MRALKGLHTTKPQRKQSSQNLTRRRGGKGRKKCGCSEDLRAFQPQKSFPQRRRRRREIFGQDLQDGHDFLGMRLPAACLRGRGALVATARKASRQVRQGREGWNIEKFQSHKEHKDRKGNPVRRIFGGCGAESRALQTKKSFPQRKETQRLFGQDLQDGTEAWRSEGPLLCHVIRIPQKTTGSGAKIKHEGWQDRGWGRGKAKPATCRREDRRRRRGCGGSGGRGKSGRS